RTQANETTFEPSRTCSAGRWEIAGALICASHSVWGCRTAVVKVHDSLRPHDARHSFGGYWVWCVMQGRVPGGLLRISAWCAVVGFWDGCFAAGPAGVFQRQGNEGRGDGQDDRRGQHRRDGPRRGVRGHWGGGREWWYRCKGRRWRCGGCPRGRGQADDGSQAGFKYAELRERPR